MLLLVLSFFFFSKTLTIINIYKYAYIFITNTLKPQVSTFCVHLTHFSAQKVLPTLAKDHPNSTTTSLTFSHFPRRSPLIFLCYK